MPQTDSFTLYDATFRTAPSAYLLLFLIGGALGVPAAIVFLWGLILWQPVFLILALLFGLCAVYPLIAAIRLLTARLHLHISETMVESQMTGIWAGENSFVEPLEAYLGVGLEIRFNELLFKQEVSDEKASWRFVLVHEDDPTKNVALSEPSSVATTVGARRQMAALIKKPVIDQDALDGWRVEAPTLCDRYETAALVSPPEGVARPAAIDVVDLWEETRLRLPRSLFGGAVALFSILPVGFLFALGAVFSLWESGAFWLLAGAALFGSFYALISACVRDEIILTPAAILLRKRGMGAAAFPVSALENIGLTDSGKKWCALEILTTDLRRYRMGSGLPLSVLKETAGYVLARLDGWEEEV